MVNETGLGDEFDALVDVNFDQFKNAHGPTGTHLRFLRRQLCTFLNQTGDVANATNWEQKLDEQVGFWCNDEGEFEDCRKRLSMLYPEVRSLLNGFLAHKCETKKD